MERNFANTVDICEEEKAGDGSEEEKENESGEKETGKSPQTVALRVEIVVEQGYGTKILDSGQVRIDAGLSNQGRAHVSTTSPMSFFNGSSFFAQICEISYPVKRRRF